MPSRHDPANSLADIVENAGRVERYLTGMDRNSFEQDGMIRDAVERCLERVCEAVHRLGDQADLLMPGHPWGDIRGMGNRLPMPTIVSASTFHGMQFAMTCHVLLRMRNVS